MSSKSLSLNKFVTRYAVREEFKNEKGETEAAIYLTDQKTVCASSETFKFYAKIGGFLNLQDLNTQKVTDLLSKLETPAFFMAMTNYRTMKGPKLYAVVCPQIDTKALQIPAAPLVSFLPRIDGKNGDVLCGLRIASSDTSKHRDWTRFVGSNKSNPIGFHELKFGYDFNNDYKTNTKAKYVGFYVDKNCSLLVYDIGTIDPNKGVNAEQNLTLIQEGGFVYADADLLFKICGEPEDKLFSAKELYEKFKDSENSVLGTDRYKKSHLIRDKKEPKERSVIFFLKMTPSLLPFELHITDDVSKESLFKGKRTAVLTIPSGGQFEYVDYWQLRDGIEVVNKRQKSEPWNKYLQKESDAQDLGFESKVNDIPIKSYPDKNGTPPQNEELFKKIKKVRKKIFGGKDGKDGPQKDVKNDSKKNKTPKETKTTAEVEKQNNDVKSPEDSAQQNDKPTDDKS